MFDGELAFKKESSRFSDQSGICTSTKISARHSTRKINSMTSDAAPSEAAGREAHPKRLINQNPYPTSTLVHTPKNLKEIIRNRVPWTFGW